MAKLVLSTGKFSGTEFVVTAGMVIGRRHELPLTLDDPKASREHAKIVAHGEGFALVDLESTNGTFVNGNRIQQTRLRDGDSVRIGQTELSFEDAEQAEPEPAPIPEVAEPKAGAKQDETQKVDMGQPPPKRLKIDAPPPKTVNVKLTPKKSRRPKRK
ncbi:MAG: FHA domain-containing protein [Planctomycetota bacterium]|jgi:pSer/pThr/pTyr-binding forkhead associated (FHA) protein